MQELNLCLSDFFKMLLLEPCTNARTLPMPANVLQAILSELRPRAKTATLLANFFQASYHAKTSSLPANFLQATYHLESRLHVKPTLMPTSFHRSCLSFRVSSPSKDSTSASLVEAVTQGTKIISSPQIPSII